MTTRLKMERKRLGLSQTDLASRAGRLSGSDISRFERLYAKPYPRQAAQDRQSPADGSG